MRVVICTKYIQTINTPDILPVRCEIVRRKEERLAAVKTSWMENQALTFSQFFFWQWTSAKTHPSHLLDLCISPIRILPSLCLSAFLSLSPHAVVFATANMKPWPWKWRCCSLLAEVNMQGRLCTAKPVKLSFKMMENLVKEKHSVIHHHVANTLHRHPKWLLVER